MQKLEIATIEVLSTISQDLRADKDSVAIINKMVRNGIMEIDENSAISNVSGENAKGATGIQSLTLTFPYVPGIRLDISYEKETTIITCPQRGNIQANLRKTFSFDITIEQESLEILSDLGAYFAIQLAHKVYDFDVHNLNEFQMFTFMLAIAQELFIAREKSPETFKSPKTFSRYSQQFIKSMKPHGWKIAPKLDEILQDKPTVLVETDSLLTINSKQEDDFDVDLLEMQRRLDNLRK